MTERQIDPQELEAKAQAVVTRLKEVAANHERSYPPIIEAVLVFSGPGTYYKRLKDSRPEEGWMRFMDRDRIRAGVAVVRQVTAVTKALVTGIETRTNQIMKEDIEQYGPLFVYNGIPEENEIFRQALASPFCKLPKDKVVIIDEVAEVDGTTHSIRHTADQVRSFYQELENPQSPLHRIVNVALVAHIPDFARNVFYTKKYNDEFMIKWHGGLRFWVYALKSRAGTGDEHIAAELPRLVKYAEAGHLATEPSDFST
ncbi:hypothetical protein A2Z23_02930 [Candidatus Curtissbacteria bacterium RBG_16_39_7]|uniref:Uncharacterized protein n=1 Tax=Candidatus Curtissbacteria bacterium RBG_16_39_7 TaxID=1797707 RepID=A0A1F5G3S6_9BACT|nr:MAG: hypothetical protein A2Z23_02930 [Candidatus Curtissbacteria bacterium RBG_16_39_7]